MLNSNWRLRRQTSSTRWATHNLGEVAQRKSAWSLRPGAFFTCSNACLRVSVLPRGNARAAEPDFAAATRRRDVGGRIAVEDHEVGALSGRERSVIGRPFAQDPSRVDRAAAQRFERREAALHVEFELAMRIEAANAFKRRTGIGSERYRHAGAQGAQRVGLRYLRCGSPLRRRGIVALLPLVILRGQFLADPGLECGAKRGLVRICRRRIVGIDVLRFIERERRDVGDVTIAQLLEKRVVGDRGEREARRGLVVGPLRREP